MNKKLRGIICLLVFVMLAAGCSQTSNFGSSVQQFFGFNRPTHTPMPVSTATAVPNEQKAQNAVQPDADPFGSSKSGGGLADLDWDDFDPALIEPDTPETETKTDPAQENWTEDPYAYSFSPSSFYEGDEAAETSEQKQAPQNPVVNPGQNPPAPGPDFPIPGNNQPVNPVPDRLAPVNPDPVRPRPQPSGMQAPMTFYMIREHPVFRPMCELPRTGFPTGVNTPIRESVTYAKTNMSISIPTLNVDANIVIVPLVEDNFPVESLGDNIGLLEGSGPGKDDLLVLAAHNHLNNQDQGPFVELSAMKESDLIFISGANNSSRTFVVYANELFAADDIDGLGMYAKPGCMILITCEDESIEGGYLNRRVVFAEAKEES